MNLSNCLKTLQGNYRADKSYTGYKKELIALKVFNPTQYAKAEKRPASWHLAAY